MIIKSLPPKKYIEMFSEAYELIQGDNYFFAVLPNEFDDFRQFSYVNGLNIASGGAHIDYITTEIVNRLRDTLIKKFKTIKPGDIRNKLMVVAVMKEFNNLKFDSQTKEKVTNSVTEIKSYFGEIDFDSLAKKILKNSAIIDPITEVYKLKEELKRRQEMKGLEKPKKKIKSEKYLPAIGTKKYLMIAEGDCLEENTEIMLSDYSTKKIKDINQGDTIISGDLTFQKVISKVKLLKETLTIKTASGNIVCGKKHKLKIYDTFEKSFRFEEAQIIVTDLSRFKLVKSKINQDTRGMLVSKNDIINLNIYLEDGVVSYTSNDFFIVIRENYFVKVFSKEVLKNDILLLS